MESSLLEDWYATLKGKSFLPILFLLTSQVLPATFGDGWDRCQLNAESSRPMEEHVALMAEAQSGSNRHFTDVAGLEGRHSARRRTCVQRARSSESTRANLNPRWGLGRPSRMQNLLLMSAIFSAALLSVHGKTTETVIVSDSNWVFLDKFVYDDTGGGVFKYEIQVMSFGRNEEPGATESHGGNSYNCKCVLTDENDEPIMRNGEEVSCEAAGETPDVRIKYTACTVQERPGAFLLFYNDVDGGENSWQSVYTSRETTTCDERAKRAQQPIPLGMGQVNSGTVDISTAARPRFWYVVLANCEKRSLRASVKVQFKNDGWQGSSPSLSSEFSFDEQGMLEMTIFYFTMYALGICGVSCIVRDFRSKNIMHEIHWLLVASFLAYMLGHLTLLIHLVKYSEDGIGYDWLTIFSRCFEVVGFLVFVNVLILIARGWTITTNKLSRKVENVLFSFVITCIYIALFFTETLQDPATTTYLYDTWAGYLFIAMQCFLLIVFIYLLHRTFVFEKRVVKRSFYKRFGIVFSLWFLKLPILVVIANVVEPWYRAKVLFGCEHGFQLLAFLLIPSLSKPKTALEIYAAANYDARIPSIARQMRVQPGVTAEIVNLPGHNGATISLPQAQVAGSLPGGLPPVNRNMTTDLNEANRRQQTEIEEAQAQAQAQQESEANGNGNGNGHATAGQEGEGIIEHNES